MNWTFGRKLALGFALAVAVLLGVGFAGHQNIEQLVDTSEWVDHTQLVMLRLTVLESLVKDSETSARGFVVTGQESMLEPHLHSQKDIQGIQNELRSLISDNQQQVVRLAALSALIEAKLEVVRDQIRNPT